MKYIDYPEKMQKEILKKTYLFALFPIVFSLIAGEYDITLGFIFGLIIATLLLRLKYNNIIRAMSMEEEDAEKFIRNRYFIEYTIYFVVLTVARLNPSLNYLAAAVGLFMIKFTVLLWMLLDMVRGGLNKKLKEYKKLKDDKTEKGGN
jgi:Ca2+/Na+ antiporter